MTPTGNSGFTLATKRYGKGNGTDVSSEVVEQFHTALTKADERIASLESELISSRTVLVRNRATLNRLLADDLQTCEELAELQKVIWGYHRGLPGDCGCSICVEVEQRQRELKGFIVEGARTSESFPGIL